MIAMEGQDEEAVDLSMREMRSAGPESLVGGLAAAKGRGQVPGLPEMGAVRPGATGEDKGSMRQRIAAWKHFVEERIAYWGFSEQVADDAGLLGEVPYCAWKRVQFEELLECLKRMEAILPRSA